jgi:hypothetical protein
VSSGGVHFFPPIFSEQRHFFRKKFDIQDIETERRHITLCHILDGPVGGKVFGVRKERYTGKKEGYD